MSIIMTLRLFFVFVVSCMQSGCFGMEQQLVVARSLPKRYVKLPDERVEDIVVFVGKNDPFDLRCTACLDRQWNTITNGLWVTQGLFPLYDPSLLCTYGAKQYHGVNRALFTAIENGNNEDASLLLRNEYANPNYTCEWEFDCAGADDNNILTSMSPLSLACNKGNIDIMKSFIKKGARVNVVRFASPVKAVIFARHSMVSNDTKKICLQLLIDNGADMSYAPGHCNYLHRAAGESNTKALIPFLVSCGINVNQKNAKGEIPLLTVLEHHNGSQEEKDAVIALIEAGSDLNATAHDGWSALRHAQENIWLEDTELQKIILEAAVKNVEK